VWRNGRVPDKTTSEQLRLEAEQLRATAIELMEHAAVRIEKSAQLEKQISLSRNNSKQRKKPPARTSSAFMFMRIVFSD
jgi:hypothetical protein